MINVTLLSLHLLDAAPVKGPIPVTKILILKSPESSQILPLLIWYHKEICCPKKWFLDSYNLFRKSPRHRAQLELLLLSCAQGTGHRLKVVIWLLAQCRVIEHVCREDAFGIFPPALKGSRHYLAHLLIAGPFTIWDLRLYHIQGTSFLLTIPPPHTHTHKHKHLQTVRQFWSWKKITHKG